MRLLLIDNGTRHLEQLEALLSRHEVTTIEPDGLDEVSVADHEAIILSGSYEHSVVYDQAYFLKEVELVRTTDRPILGICLGFELICYAYGCQLHELAEKIEGAGQVTPTGEGAKIFQGTDPIRVFEGHRWNVEDVPKELVVLARSDSGIEAVRHRLKPMYGLQFHPEDFRYGSDGKMVFQNIIDMLRKAT